MNDTQRQQGVTHVMAKVLNEIHIAEIDQLLVLGYYVTS